MAKRIIGLDIGTFAVKIVEFEPRAKGARILGIYQKLVPEGVVIDGEVIDQSEVVRVIKELLNESHIRTRRCVLVIGGTKTVVRSVDFPVMGDAELAEALTYQVVETLPIPKDQLVYDFHRQGGVITSTDGAIQRVLVAGAQHDVVFSNLEAAKTAGLEVIGVDLASLAGARALSSILWQTPATSKRAPSGVPSTTETKETGQTVLVEVGGGVTTLILLDANGISFVRSLPVGGSSITAQIAREVGCSATEAEWLKRGGYLDTSRIGIDQSAKVTEILSSSVSNLVNEISSSLDYYLLQSENQSIDRLWLSGGGSQLDGLIELLSERLNLRVEEAPFIDILQMLKGEALLSTITPTISSSGFTSLGLVMWQSSIQGGREREKGLSLLPDYLVQRSQARKQFAGVGAVTGGVVVILAGASAYQIVQNMSVSSQLNTVNGAIAGAQVQLSKLSNISTMANSVTGLESQIAADTLNSISWAQVLGQVARATPSDLYLNSFSGTSSSAAIGGTISVQITGCSQESPRNWLDSISALKFIAEPWVSASSLAPAQTGAAQCLGVNYAGVPATSIGVTTFASTANVTASATGSRVSLYENPGLSK